MLINFRHLAIAASLFLATCTGHLAAACDLALGGGPWRFDISTDQLRVRIILGNLSNLDGGRSRPLSVHLVAYNPRDHATWFDDPHHIMATIDFRDYPNRFGDGTLDFFHVFRNIDMTVPFSKPPDGVYEVALAPGFYDPRFGGPDGGYQLCALRAASILNSRMVSEGGVVRMVPL